MSRATNMSVECRWLVGAPHTMTDPNGWSRSLTQRYFVLCFHRPYIIGKRSLLIEQYGQVGYCRDIKTTTWTISSSWSSVLQGRLCHVDVCWCPQLLYHIIFFLYESLNFWAANGVQAGQWWRHQRFVSFFLLVIFPLFTAYSTYWFPVSRVPFALLCFALLHFDIGNYNNFHRFFHNDSEMILAETGAYKGADSIEEYTWFTNTKESPYFIVSPPLLKRKIRFLCSL